MRRPGRVIDAIRVVEVAGFTDKMRFLWTPARLFVTVPNTGSSCAVFRLYWAGDPAVSGNIWMAAMFAWRSVAYRRPPRSSRRRNVPCRSPAGRCRRRPRREEDGPTQMSRDRDPRSNASLTMSSARTSCAVLNFELMSTCAEVAEAKIDAGAVRACRLNPALAPRHDFPRGADLKRGPGGGGAGGGGGPPSTSPSCGGALRARPRRCNKLANLRTPRPPAILIWWCFAIYPVSMSQYPACVLHFSLQR